MPPRPIARRPVPLALCLAVGLGAGVARAESPATRPTTMPTTLPAAAPALDPADAGLPPIAYAKQTLGNGLTVIYAPMDNAPVVQVRVLYHVGSRDEQPDRQGFAHMFEHMMFRGSAHVPPERHMKLVDDVGGDSNAFTSFDQTTYHDTLPSNQLQMALWLEADRMSSFTVTPGIFATERNVVAEEWRMRYANPPYGNFFQDFFKTAYSESHYQWTAIGDMAQLAAAQPEELQEFFNKYYVPNNAVLVIAGEFDRGRAERWVEQYFGWIPEGDPIARVSPPEPPQGGERDRTEYKPQVPLVRTMLGFKTADYADDDHYALSLLGSILSDGDSSRLYRAMVGNDDPIAAAVAGGDYQLQDTGVFIVQATGLPMVTPDRLRAAVLEQIDRVRRDGVSDEELAKAKTQTRVALINARETAEDVAGQLGEAQLFAGDAEEANRAWPKTQAVTPADVRRVADQYLRADRLTVLNYVPGEPPADDATARAATAAEREAEAKDRAAAESIKDAAGPADPNRVEPKESKTGPGGDPPAGSPDAMFEATTDAMPEATSEATTAPATRPATAPAASAVDFPPNYPTTPPVSDETISATFEKGTEVAVGPVRVIVLPDHRLPLVDWALVLRGGGHAEPAGKEGVASMTAEMITRGSAGRSLEQISDELDGRGLSLNAVDGGDHTKLGGSGPSDQLPLLMSRARDALLSPDFPADEFARLKQQTLSGLSQQLSDPATVAGRDLVHALYGDSALGRLSSPATVGTITLDDVKDWYAKTYRPGGAFLVLSGDVTVEQAKALVGDLVAGWPDGPPPTADYDLPTLDTDALQITIVDNPGGGQASIRMAAPAYKLDDEADKYPGSVAGRILSSGIDSRMNKSLRAEKGLTYGAAAYFSPGRHAGEFTVRVDTKPATAGEAIAGSFEVLKTMTDADVTPAELSETKRMVAGSMVMETQTVGQQASRRVDVELNGYPLDYFDVYPKKIDAVTADGVRETMAEYVAPRRFTAVVVGPADVIRPQVEAMGDVTVVPMPLQRDATTRPAE